MGAKRPFMFCHPVESNYPSSENSPNIPGAVGVWFSERLKGICAAAASSVLPLPGFPDWHFCSTDEAG